jgi:hypothetical protein
VTITALVGTHGVISLRADGDEIARVDAGLEAGGGIVSQESARPQDQDPGNVPPVRRGVLRAPGGAEVNVETRAELHEKSLKLSYGLTPIADLGASGVTITIKLRADVWKGGTWSAGSSSGEFPLLFSNYELLRERASSITLASPKGYRLTIALPRAAPLLLTDSRRWFRPLEFALSLGPYQSPTAPWAAGETRAWDMTLEMGAPLSLDFDEPTTVEESGEWIPLKGGLDIEPGSALDFLQLGLTDPPAGKYGWLRSVGDHFEFETVPGRPVRFYGINLVYSSLYLDHEQCDRFADRLARMGYNSVRIHHYERELVDPRAPDTLTFRPDSLDRLDYLVAALKRRGLYVSTDLYVSRRVKAAEVFPGAEGYVSEFKLLLPVSQAAFANWQEFSRRLLTHINPYTGLAWKDDPAIPLLSMVNEGMFLNFWDRLDERSRPLWQAAFNRWLLEEYGARVKLAAAWGEALAADEDPALGTVQLPQVFGDDVKGLALARFSAAIQAETFARMKRFLRDELGCRALLTDMNGWTDIPQNQYARTKLDYVDAHFYWDHPESIRGPWRLPSRGWSGGGSAVAAAGLDLRAKALIRLYNHPFTVSEYNWAGPTKYRAESGLLTGAFGALQDWSGLWRYAYSESREATFQPTPISYFYIGSDLLRTATERAAICLYLRGDVRPATTRVAVTGTAEDLVQTPRTPFLSPELSRLGWVTQLGMWIRESGQVSAEPDVAMPVSGRAPGGPKSPNLLQEDPFSDSALGAAVERLRQGRMLLSENTTNVSEGIFESQTEQIALDSGRATFVVNTPRTAGVFAREPCALTAGPLAVALSGWGGAVWVSSLDGRPITESRRLLLVHLTDLQNSGTRFADRERLILEEWGRLPYLVRTGTAGITLSTEQAKSLKVWALDTTGKRVARLEAAASEGALSFVASTRGPDGARLYYELAAE